MPKTSLIRFYLRFRKLKWWYLKSNYQFVLETHNHVIGIDIDPLILGKKLIPGMCSLYRKNNWEYFTDNLCYFKQWNISYTEDKYLVSQCNHLYFFHSSSFKITCHVATWWWWSVVKFRLWGIKRISFIQLAYKK